MKCPLRDTTGGEEIELNYYNIDVIEEVFHKIDYP